MTKTKITKTNNKTRSVRTVIPKMVLEILELEYGDSIEWTPEVDDEKNIYFKVTKTTDDG